MVSKVLNRKLWRDLRKVRGQVFAIALIMAAGIGLLVMGLTTVQSLDETALAYYERYRFADVFAQVERAPLRTLAQISAIPGVQTAEARVMQTAVLDIPDFGEPVLAQLVSVPVLRPAKLNLVALQQGRMPRAGARDEALVAEPFAAAQGLQLGSTLRALLNGTWRELHIVGIALSPEYVYVISPGALMPDDARFGVVWMAEENLQAAFDLIGAYNALSIALLRGANVRDVIDRVDRVLAPYGGTGAIGREDQQSNWFLMNEIEQLRTLALVLPSIFLLVAAFLTNMVLARLVAMERSEIGLLKAFGYSKRDIAWHYVKLVCVIGALGVLLGWALGYVLGFYEMRIFAEFFHFPFLLFRPGPAPFLIAAAIGLLAALAGALRAVYRAASLAPAEAMLPPAPPLFHARASAKAGAPRIEQLTRIVLRQVARWPMRSFSTCLGIAMAVALLVTSLQWLDAISHMVDVYFRQAQSQDVSISFQTPRSSAVVLSTLRLPGVMTAEPMRAVAAELSAGSRRHREAIQGLPARPSLFRVYDSNGRDVALPPEGLMISTKLAEILKVERGDDIDIEILERRGAHRRVPVVGTFETYIGTPAYMEIGALARLLHERETVNTVHLRVDRLRLPELLNRLKGVPGVSAITLKDNAIKAFDDTMAETMMIMVTLFIAFSSALAFGVTYNTARIALSERGREFATLRVLGFRRAEISYILLAEIALLTLLALPFGCLIGFWLAKLSAQGFATELYRIPVQIAGTSYAAAMAVAMIATALSALFVRRRIDKLDLIAVLKTRE